MINDDNGLLGAETKYPYSTIVCNQIDLSGSYIEIVTTTTRVAYIL